MAVPRFDSTPEMPALPRMEVRLANTADPRAYQNQPMPLPARGGAASFFSIIRKVPAPISTTPRPFAMLTPSPRMMKAKRMVSTTLDLSMGTTLLMSPSCRALK